MPASSITTSHNDNNNNNNNGSKSYAPPARNGKFYRQDARREDVRDNYDIKDKLGKGRFAVVKRGVDKQTGTDVSPLFRFFPHLTMCD